MALPEPSIVDAVIVCVPGVVDAISRPVARPAASVVAVVLRSDASPLLRKVTVMPGSDGLIVATTDEAVVPSAVT